MMKQWLFLGIVAASLTASTGTSAPLLSQDGSRDMFRLAELSPDDQAQVAVLGGRKVPPALFSASFYSREDKCTSSLIGPRVLLTAAHCVESRRVRIHLGAQLLEGACDVPEAYEGGDDSADYGLCLFEVQITATPYFETISIDPERLLGVTELLLTGFGCTSAGGGGDFTGTVYRVGEARIVHRPDIEENRIITRGRVAVCFGDSGGPAFVQEGSDGGPRVQVAVNGAGNIRDLSALPSLSTPVAIQFIQQWSAARNVLICGVHSAASKCRP